MFFAIGKDMLPTGPADQRKAQELMEMLHITNGDGAGGIIEACDISGDVLPWRDPMHHGPFPAGLSLDDVRPIRAKHLAGPGLDVRDVERDIQDRDDRLKAFSQYGRVVLWFEHDLLDQLQILQLLDWFSTAKPDDAQLDLICTNRFPGVATFRGMGQLTPQQMASLFEQRVPVTPAMLSLAQAGWQAFCADDPRQLTTFLNGDLHPLPFLHKALLRYCEEFPSVSNRLSQTEEQLLNLVAAGVNHPHQLFLENMELETALFLGDWGTYSVIKLLCREGMLASKPSPFWYHALSAQERSDFGKQILSITDKGQRVLSGASPQTDPIKRDQWLGGVHIQSGKPSWMWDRKTMAFVRA